MPTLKKQRGNCALALVIFPHHRVICLDWMVHREAVAQITAETHPGHEAIVNEVLDEIPADAGGDGWYWWFILFQVYEDIFKEDGQEMPPGLIDQIEDAVDRALRRAGDGTKCQVSKVVVVHLVCIRDAAHEPGRPCAPLRC